jgi:hypothetical protein
MHGSSIGSIENTIRKQWTAVILASEPCSTSRVGGLAAHLVGRNRFIAPISPARSGTAGTGASGYARRRNNAIAPYEPHFASFNFTNALI